MSARTILKHLYKEGRMTDYQYERIDRCLKARQGEWVAREDMDYLDENKVFHKHFGCNKCGLIHDFIDGHTSQYNYCPKCGAKMKKGGEEE